jgi:DNA-directed RNA polymerase specialized sigma24 family protein
MADVCLQSKSERELLSSAIVHALQSWPAFQRQIFTDVHYGGRRIEDLSSSLNVSPEFIRDILNDCERRLRAALRSYWRRPNLLPLQGYSVGRCFL